MRSRYLLGVMMKRFRRAVNAFCEAWGRPDEPDTKDERDKALIVSLLASLGAQSVSDICWHMKDYTRGEHDWLLRSEKKIYRLLDQLESEGTIQHEIGRYSERREYSLVAPAERLVRVK